jgi:hypothetical protein
MLFIGILMLYLTGAALIVRISKEFNIKEMISLSFLIGLGINTFFMFLCDVIGFGFTQYVLFFASFALIVFSYDDLLAYFSAHKKNISLPNLNLSYINYPAALLFGLGLVFFYIITAKNLYWPTTEYDAIGSYDKLGMVMALEGKIKISLFEWGLQGSGGIYPPYFHGGIAYMYLFGAESPKIITTLFYVSLILFFYSIVKKYVSAIVALFFTLLLMLTPELYSHAALLLSNIPTTALVGAGALSLFIALDKERDDFLWISAILFMLGLWCRHDTIGFALAAILIVSFRFFKEKNWKLIGAYALIVMSSFIVWSLYLKFKIDIPATSRLVDSFSPNFQKLDIMITYVISMLSWKQFGALPPGYLLYGLGFLLPILFTLINIKTIKTNKPFVLVFFAISFLVFFMIFFLIDEKKQAATIFELMESSFKRGMFYFLPTLIFYAATTPVTLRFSSWLERFRNQV